MIQHGDCLEVMAGMPAASVDAIVTDPPYGLSFMGKAWDHGVPAGPFWAEMLRVAKPGAYLLAFGGTRTVHRIATNIEDAGWIIRDTLVWCYASGFPKGRANLKPAWEPIVMARKPGPLQPLAIDECRIGMIGENLDKLRARSGGKGDRPSGGLHDGGITEGKGEWDLNPSGRWPSNVLLSDPELFDEPNPWVVGSGATATSGKMMPTDVQSGDRTVFGQDSQAGYTTIETYGDTGGYSRFFIIPKADRADREPVLRGQIEKSGTGLHDDDGYRKPGERKANHTAPMPRENAHPTVKPTDLMRHLVRLVTPPGGTVLDPFLGSGTTALACELEGFPWIGIEKEAEYVAIAEARLNGVQRGLGLDTPLVGEPRVSRDGVAVRHNSGGNTFGGDKPKPPLPDMGYGRPRQTPARAESVPGLFDRCPEWIEAYQCVLDAGHEGHHMLEVAA